MKKAFQILKEYIKNLIKCIVKNDFANAAGEMAYMMALGIFPFMLFIMAVFGWLGKKTFINKILFGLSTVAPNDVIDLIYGVLNEVAIFKGGKLMAIIGVFVTLFITSNAVAVIIKGMNRAADIQENRNFIKVKLISILMVFINTFFLFISINLIVLGKVILNFIGFYLSIPHEIIETILFIRWPIAFITLFLLATINYYVLPARDFSVKRKSVIPGAMFFCVFWLIGSFAFSLYVNALGTYNRVYGTIGTFAILMVWLYYSSIILLIGAQVNNQTLRRFIILDKQKERAIN